MGLIVQKYGGTSVGSTDRIKAVAQHIRDTVLQGHHAVVVVSAMGDETDKLLALAHEVSPTPEQRELDMLLTAGERISMSLLSIALHELGVDSISLTGSQCGILTDGHHGNARIHRILGDRVRGGLIDDKVVIVAGFQGMCLDNKEITTLGRGGSDLSAIALAQTLDADICEIYKDVEGIYTADPRIVPQTRKLAELSLSSLLELTWSGASILHARAAFLAKKFDVPMLIRSSFNFTAPGTKIVPEKGDASMEMESIVVKAIAHKNAQSLIRISTNQENLFSKGLKWLWSQGETPIISQKCLNTTQNYDILHILNTNLSQRFCDYVKTATQHEQHIAIERLDDLATVTIIGEGFWQDPEFVSNALLTIESPVEFFESKNTTLTFCIGSIYLEKTIRALHTSCF